jgi:CDP-glucose 4,6-dehydratase
MEPFFKAFAGKRVLVTGHTGFKGSWLSEWLLGLDANVWGFSLPPPTKPALFRQLGLESRLKHIVGDVRDPAVVARVVTAADPDFVFHMAAQPIVRSAHAHPADTWSTNVMGSVNVLEALRKLRGPCAAVIVTTDKVYQGSAHARAEEDLLGGGDPYGASKAAVELAVDAWREAFFPLPKPGNRAMPSVALATARSGNVIGGGDWAKDRLLPDCVRALAKGEPILVRNPRSVRPWQHVLDPLAGYLMLGAGLRGALVARSSAQLAGLSGPFNFGPAPSDHRQVGEVIARVLAAWSGNWRSARAPNDPKEAAVLRLDSHKAQRVLGWRPRWRFTRAVDQTVAWYRGAVSPRKAVELTLRQLAEYTAA